MHIEYKVMLIWKSVVSLLKTLKVSYQNWWWRFAPSVLENTAIAVCGARSLSTWSLARRLLGV